MNELRARIQALAKAYGFQEARLSDATLLEEDQRRLREFAASERLGDMAWFRRSLAARLDPQLLLSGARSVLSLATCYRSKEHENALEKARIRISRYAGGRDYHRVLKKRASGLMNQLLKEWCDAGNERFQFRVCVDAQPIPEKIFARKAGLGWQGKHTNLIHPQLGSYFFIVCVLLDISIPEDQPLPDLCRDCRLCIDACPTGALEEYRILADRCLSYVTIERRSAYPLELQGRTRQWAFGCDICQEVCPYNRNRRTRELFTEDPEFGLRPALARWMESGGPENETDWEENTRGSALRRPGFARFQENCRIAAGGQTAPRKIDEARGTLPDSSGSAEAL